MAGCLQENAEAGDVIAPMKLLQEQKDIVSLLSPTGEQENQPVCLCGVTGGSIMKGWANDEKLMIGFLQWWHTAGHFLKSKKRILDFDTQSKTKKKVK